MTTKNNYLWVFCALTVAVPVLAQNHSASAFLAQNGMSKTPIVAMGTGVGNGTQGEEKAVRVLVADGLSVALLAQDKSPIERIKKWSVNLKFLVEKANEDADNTFEKKGAREAQNMLYDSLQGINDSLTSYPSISGVHTPRLVKRLVKIWGRIDERYKEIAAQQKADGKTVTTDGSERLALAKYRILKKMLQLIVNVEKNFDQKYVIPAVLDTRNEDNQKASDDYLKRLEIEFAHVIYKEYAFITKAMTTDSGDGQVRNEVPYSFFLNFTELAISDIEEDLSTNLYGYSNGEAILRLDDLKDKLLNFNLKGDRNWSENSNEAFKKTVAKLNIIRDQYLSQNATPDNDNEGDDQ